MKHVVRYTVCGVKYFSERIPFRPQSELGPGHVRKTIDCMIATVENFPGLRVVHP